MYELVQYLEKPDLKLTETPLAGKHLLVVGVEFSPDTEEDIEKWYEEEHFPVVSKIPGWLRGRRYKLVSQVELAGKAESGAPPAHTFLSIHEWDNPDFIEDLKRADIYQYTWSKRVWK